MRIALVNPAARRTRGYHNCGSVTPQLGLQVLAKLTPAGHEVELIDENLGGTDTEEMIRSGRYDLVGVTSYTSGAPRAYEIGSVCRAAGAPSILGGPHAWACPDEAAAYFDSVAVGECDTIWEGIVSDAAAGQLQARYEGEFADLSAGHGAAAQDVQPINGRYEIGCIQMSRGCPVGCEYCSVTRFNGAKIRRRPIDDIIEEWNRIPAKFVFVVDDNFFGVGREHARWAKELLRALIAKGKKRLWFSQTTVNMGEDPEALRLAYKAGCRGMLVGFESFSKANLESCHKVLNQKYQERYGELVQGFHRAGMAVFGAFIVGLEADTEDTVSETVLAAVRLGVDILQVTNMTPLPGTKVYERMMEEGRIFATDYPKDWERYTFVETVFHPGRMTAQRLDETIYELREAAAAAKSWPDKRALRTLWRTRSLSTALFARNVNAQFARLARALSPADAERFGYRPGVNCRTRRIQRSLAMWPGTA